MVEKKEKIKQRGFAFYLMIILITLVLAASYAAFSYKEERDENIVQTGTLILDLDEKNSLNLANSIPTSDTDALESKAYEFSVKNTGSENAKYRIYLLEDTDKYQTDNCSDKKMPWTSLKYLLEKNGDAGAISELTDEGVLLESVVKEKETDKYALRIWIKSSAGNEVAGLHFHAKLKIKAILEDKTDYDTGA